jgi:hypothetical protein
VLTAGVSVVEAEGDPVVSGEAVPMASVSVETGGRVLRGGLVGVAAVEQADNATANTSTTPKNLA